MGEGFVMGDWAQLPSDLLALIAKRTHSYDDFIAFGGVCRSWRRVAVKENSNQSLQIPWLLFPEEEKGVDNNLGGLVSLTKGGMVHRVELPEARGKRFICSSICWLITVDRLDEMELLHPLTRFRIPLPHPTTFKYYTMNSQEILLERAVLSGCPSVNEDYALMVILRGGYVGFWKPGNIIWNVIETQPSYCVDVIYYKDQFYATNNQGDLLLCNLNSGASQIVGKIPWGGIADKTQAYLVECGGELLVVVGEAEQPHCGNLYVRTDMLFRVFKFDSTDFNKWRDVDDFRGRSIFVAHGAAASAVIACAAAGTKSNCIYYADPNLNQYAALYPSRYIGTGIYKWVGQIEPLVSNGLAFGNEIIPI